MTEKKVSVRVWIEQHKDEFDSKEKLIEACVKATGKAKITASIQYGRITKNKKTPQEKPAEVKKEAPSEPKKGRGYLKFTCDNEECSSKGSTYETDEEKPTCPGCGKEMTETE